MFDKEAIQELAKAEAIRAAHEAVISQVGEITALPNDFQIHDLEQYLQMRRRARGTMSTSTPKDFAEYAKKHAINGASVFVNSDNMSATAVLNLGTPEEPGHADNKAVLQLKKTAAFSAMLQHTATPMTQAKAAEFVEDWSGFVKCYSDAGEISPPKAIAALRKITIEGMRKLESSEQSLSASKSAFESVQATSADPIPTFIYFECAPYLHLSSRTFVLRLGIHTGADKPSIVLRVIKAEQHAEEMADELAAVVRATVGDSMPILLGQYAKS